MPHVAGWAVIMPVHVVGRGHGRVRGWTNDNTINKVARLGIFSLRLSLVCTETLAAGQTVQNRCEMMLGKSFEPLSQFDDFWPCRIVAWTTDRRRARQTDRRAAAVMNSIGSECPILARLGSWLPALGHRQILMHISCCV